MSIDLFENVILQNILAATNIRLIGGEGPFEGLVEVYHDGNWGTICKNGFDVNDAKVICASLGYIERYWIDI